MTKKSRGILFLFLLFLFILIAPVAILYSQGYRFDFPAGKIVQTGGFYFKVSPRNAQIFINENFKKKTDFLFGAAFLENLSPQKYKIEIKKDGFYGWNKNLEIKEKQVTEAKNVLLIPEKLIFSVFNEGVESFWFSPDEKKIILREKDVSDSKNTSWSLKLYDLERNIKVPLAEASDFAKFQNKFNLSEIKVVDLTWSQDQKIILIKILIANQIKYFVLETDKTPPSFSSLDFLGKEAEEISLHPSDSQKIFFEKPVNPVRDSSLSGVKEKGGKISNDLLTANYKTKEIGSVVLENPLAYSFFEENIYWLSEKGFVFRSDLSDLPAGKAGLPAGKAGKNQKQITLNPFPLNQDAKYQIIANAYPEIFLQEDSSLYSFDQNLKSFEKFFEPVKNLELSPDLQKIAYSNENEIWVLFLKEQNGQPQRKAGERLFLTRFSEKINKVFWLNSHYLLLDLGQTIKVMEIDDRDQLNIVELETNHLLSPVNPSETGPKVFFNKEYQELYILNGEKLYASDSLPR